MKILARNREEKSSKMPGKILALILSATMFITPRFSVFAAPTGPGASPETERYDAATLARLQDNRIEYDEIPDLVHEYNPDISKAWNTYKNSRSNSYKHSCNRFCDGY